MRICLIWVTALTVGAVAWAAQPASSPAKKTTPARKTAKKTAVAVHKAPAKTATVRRTPAKKAAPRTTWRNRQAQPMPDRLKEIQDALANRGYLAPAGVSGSWDQSSMDALKRFQTDQNLASSGKINSLSLIALGLGPKYDLPGTVVLDVNTGQQDR
jgi:hypothetical protein